MEANGLMSYRRRVPFIPFTIRNHTGCRLWFSTVTSTPTKYDKCVVFCMHAQMVFPAQSAFLLVCAQIKQGSCAVLKNLTKSYFLFSKLKTLKSLIFHAFSQKGLIKSYFLVGWTDAYIVHN